MAGASAAMGLECSGQPLSRQGCCRRPDVSSRSAIGTAVWLGARHRLRVNRCPERLLRFEGFTSERQRGHGVRATR